MKMRLHRGILCAFTMVSVLLTSGQVHDTQTGVLEPSFKSLQVKIAGDDQIPAVLMADTPHRIEISFDELADSRRYMRYSIVHCDARWRPDNLPESMYLTGFNEGEVSDFRYSVATTVNYVHYSIILPNEQIGLKVSGNYLLKVYDESDPDKILLQARFQICENTVSVGASSTTRTDVDYNAGHQQLSLAVEPKRAEIDNPFRDLLVTVSQNGRVDNIQEITLPSRVSGRRLYYEHNPALIFPAGNEYRRFETITLNYPSMRVAEMGFTHPYYQAFLYVDYPRSSDGYLYDKTQFGRYRVRDYDSDESDINAEYVLTHFSLEMPELPGRDVYIDGDLVNRRFDDTSRMIYNRASQRYESTLLLKQGSYNYQYLVAPIGSATASSALIEGDRYQTTNEYQVCVYYHKPGELYDRLVGYLDFKSNN